MELTLGRSSFIDQLQLNHLAQCASYQDRFLLTSVAGLQQKKKKSIFIWLKQLKVVTIPRFAL